MEPNARRQAFESFLFVLMADAKKAGQQVSGFVKRPSNFTSARFQPARRAIAHAAPRLKASELNY